MKTYIGVKIVQAEPLTLGAYNQRRGWTIPDDEDPAKPGYFLRYPDGYVSWSPADIFRGAYRLVSDDERALLEPATGGDFVTRLVAEHKALADKTVKLGEFLTTPAFEALDNRQQNLLHIQHVHMTQYLGVLDDRLSLLGVRQDAAAHDAGDRDEILETRITGGGSIETPVPFNSAAGVDRSGLND